MAVIDLHSRAYKCCLGMCKEMTTGSKSVGVIRGHSFLPGLVQGHSSLPGTTGGNRTDGAQADWKTS